MGEHPGMDPAQARRLTGVTGHPHFTPMDILTRLRAKFPAEFLSEEPLYKEVDVTGEKFWQALDLIYFDGNYDAHCLRCGEKSTFKVVGTPRPLQHTQKPVTPGAIRLARAPSATPVENPPIGAHTLTGICSRDDSHKQFFTVLLSGRAIMEPKAEGDEAKPEHRFHWFVQKIGQHPSRADLDLPKVKRYRRVLQEGQQKELATAIGLHAHGVGIGSFVYLRRIFRALVEEAHAQGRTEEGWDESAYHLADMGNRVRMLAKHLPDFMVANAHVYGVLSKGVHELTEAECLANFDIVHIAIEAILEEKLAEVLRAEKAKTAAAALSKFNPGKVDNV